MSDWSLEDAIARPSSDTMIDLVLEVAEKQEREKEKNNNCPQYSLIKTVAIYNYQSVTEKDKRVKPIVTTCTRLEGMKEYA